MICSEPFKMVSSKFGLALRIFSNNQAVCLIYSLVRGESGNNFLSRVEIFLIFLSTFIT